MNSGKSGVYIIENTENGKVYVGSSQNVHDRWSVHKRQLRKGISASKKLQRAWGKYNEHAFAFRLVLCCKPCDLLYFEQNLIERFNSVKSGYNICPIAGRPHREPYVMPQTTKDKISKKRKGWKMSEWQKDFLRAANTGKKYSIETRAKVGFASHLRGQTEETKHKLSILKKGRPLSEAHKAALRGQRGKLENIRLSKLGKKNPNFGKPRSEETKQKISEAQRGKPRKGTCQRWNINQGRPCTCGKHVS